LAIVTNGEERTDCMLLPLESVEPVELARSGFVCLAGKRAGTTLFSS
jgi:hypothetical protein